MNVITNTSIHQQRGASLIELMVGVTIGMLVVLAAASTIVLTRSSSTSISDSSLMVSQGNNAMRMIGQLLRQAGAVELIPIDATQPVGSRQYLFSNAFTGVNAGGLAIQGTEGAASPDTLSIAFENRGDEMSRDCLGNATTAAGRVQSQFSVTGTNLNCLGSGNANAQPVTENVEDFQVLYWVQQGVAPNQTQIRRTASQVVAAGGWNNVVAVDVCLQLRGDIATHPVISGSTYINCREVSTAHDGRLHQIFRSTFQLRNQGQ